LWGCGGDDNAATDGGAKSDAPSTTDGGAKSDAPSTTEGGAQSDAPSTTDGTMADSPSGEDASDSGTLEASADAGDGGTWVPLDGGRLPTGYLVTPTAAPGSTFQPLKPGLAPDFPDFVADHATSTVVSPDGETLLVLTSGYNLNVYLADAGPNEGSFIPKDSGEYIFVYDIAANTPQQKQVLKVPNSFAGIAFNPNGTEFYVAGGRDDSVHVFDYSTMTGKWSEATVTDDAGVAKAAISLGHAAGLGLETGPQAAGVAVTASGANLVVANYENDSISVVALATKAVQELDLRPGKAATSPQPGVPGGEFPFWVVIKGDDTAYVTAQRDREVVVVDLSGATPSVKSRIAVGGQPNKAILNKDESRLFVANGSSDTVSIIDTASNTVLETVQVAAPASLFPNPKGLKGANPNGLALSPDEKTLYVTDGATNAVAVVERDPLKTAGATTVGLIPTGWYPTSVSTSADGTYLYVVNAKSIPGPSCKDIAAEGKQGAGPVALSDGGFNGGFNYDACWNGNQYVWQLETAGFLTLPTPSAADLANMTQQVALNDHFAAAATPDATIQFLRQKIQHVIFVIKENRTYDQVLGDLGKGNGDPTLTMFGKEITPNLHAIAENYVTLDAFLDTGETSGVGWNWTTSAHATDEVERNQPINYGKGGLTYDWEGTNRNINVGIDKLADRLTALPVSPNDPDLLPGAVDISSSEAAGASTGSAYLWDQALAAHLTVRNYGAFVDLARYALATVAPPLFPARVRNPATQATPVQQAWPAAKNLVGNTDLYFRGFDQAYPDIWRFEEWNREFAQFVAGQDAGAAGGMPNLELVRFAHDHTGSFADSATTGGLGTPFLEVADNDYAVGALVEAVAKSPYAASTLIFVIEDDAQDGADHVDAHRSTMYVVGPYVKQNAVVSTPYNTVNVLRTIEAILGLDPLNIHDGTAATMSDVFDTTLAPSAFSYAATKSAILAGASAYAMGGSPVDAAQKKAYYAALRRGHDAAYWERATKGMNFAREDALDAEAYNRILWKGLMGGAPFPGDRPAPNAPKSKPRSHS
jgi:YVTN family beta-propeller protein